MRNNTALGFESIALNYPKLFPYDTRTACDTSVRLGNYTFNSPVVPANMKCVIDPQIAVNLALEGYFHILHRFGHIHSSNLSSVDQYELLYALQLEPSVYYKGDRPRAYSSISLGIRQDDYRIIDKLKSTGRKMEFITIDVAHGHQYNVTKTIRYIKENLPETFVIAGNVCTPEAVKFLEDEGADAVKIGIGPGRACTTFLKTGFMSPMFTTIQRCAEVARVPLIADGGVRSNGDITKALVAGATMVMVGSLFAACKDAPGRTIYTDTQWERFKAYFSGTVNERPYKKEYYGSASVYNKGNTRNIEGTKVLLNGNGMTVTEKMDEIRQDLQSAISYAGGSDLSALSSLKWDVIV